MRVTTLIAFTAMLSPCHAQRFHFSPVSEAIVLQREEKAPSSQAGRADRVKQLFVLAGCTLDKLSEQSLPNVSGTNVICRLPGRNKETIVVGANYNQVPPDNWTGAALLPSLYQSLASRKRHHTFVFVAFADGSGDLAGSQFFADQMTLAEVDRTEAMVNLNALGFSPTKISTSDSDKELVKSFVTVMYALKQAASQVDLSRALRVDSEPFASRNIPQITIHSLTHDAVAVLQPQEPPSAPKPNADFAHVETGFRSNLYYNSYSLISGYLAFLDETLKPRRHK